MITLFTDLDHTLIYSHRSKPDTPCIQVESLHDKPQSFMTEKTWTVLKALVDDEKLQIVPVTTRKKEQYDRLNCLSNHLNIRYALICNGAVLLDQGAIEPAWLDESLSIAGEQLEEVSRAENELRKCCGTEKTFFPYRIMTYGVSDNAEQYADKLRGKIDQNKCFIASDSRKVYCIPAALNKGVAVKRFRQRFDCRKSVCAGDSEFDVPMLCETDYAVFPEKLLSLELSSAYFPVKKNQILSDELCTILQYLAQAE